MNKELLQFIQSQQLLSIASVDENAKPWIANVYFSSDKNLNLFFVSSENTKHSKNIARNPEVSFSTSWYHPSNLTNRKSIQGTGICEKIDDPKMILKFLKNHYKYFPLWKSVITLENIQNKIIESRPYIIKPKYIKFWNDELYGDEGVEEFEF
jgi:uncharacterized protein YhbP (UPF0306 family)